MFGIIKKWWDKLGEISQYNIISFLIIIEASLCYRFFMPMSLRGARYEYLIYINALAHYIILFPVLIKLFMRKRK